MWISFSYTCNFSFLTLYLNLFSPLFVVSHWRVSRVKRQAYQKEYFAKWADSSFIPVPMLLWLPSLLRIKGNMVATPMKIQGGSPFLRGKSLNGYIVRLQLSIWQWLSMVCLVLKQKQKRKHKSAASADQQWFYGQEVCITRPFLVACASVWPTRSLLSGTILARCHPTSRGAKR